MGDCHSNGSCSSGGCEKFVHIASIVVLVMFVLNAGLIMINRGTQDAIAVKQNELAEKSQKISQNATFDNINRSMIQALAAIAISKKDEQVKALLIQNNIQLKPQDDKAGAKAE